MRNIYNATLSSLILLGCLVLPAQAIGAEHEKAPGYVACSDFLALAGDDTGTVEVNLHGALLKALTGFDPELKAAVGGLDSIRAVVLTFEEKSRAARALELMRQTERKLDDRGWDVLTRIKDGESNVTVLVLNDDETIRGLVVLVADAGGHEIVCASIAGVIDLASIARLGETLEIPGLDQVDDE